MRNLRAAGRIITVLKPTVRGARVWFIRKVFLAVQMIGLWLGTADFENKP